MADLEEVFGELCKYDMRLNLEKYTFRVGEGKFLGFMITHWGIEANPDKCTTILEMCSPTNVQEVQKLNGRLASLSRFLLMLAKKEKSFYKLLKKTKPFLWDKNYKQVFLAFEKTIATPQVLSRPRPRVTLLLYFSLVDEVVSSAFVQEERKHQLSIYFTSRILHDAKKRYQMIEKVALALITSA